MTRLWALLKTLLTAWRPRQPVGSSAPVHIVIASYTRRYPGRSSALQLRQNLGWIALTAGSAYRNRRA